MKEDWEYIVISLFSYYKSDEYCQFRIAILTIIIKDNDRSLFSYEKDNDRHD